MSLILTQVLSYFIPTFIALFLIAIAIAILILCAENDVESDKYRKARRECLQEEERNTNEKKVATYHKSSYYCANEKCSSTTYKFLNVLNEIFPNDFTIIPNVIVGRLIESFSVNDNISQTILNSNIDIGIFLKSEMKPLVMIDLIGDTKNNKTYGKFSKEIALTLNNLEIPSVEIVIKNEYNKILLKQELLKLMPNKIRRKYS